MRKLWILTLVGALIFLISLMGRVFITTINETIKQTDVEMVYGIVRSYDKNKTTVDHDSYVTYEFVTNMKIDVDNKQVDVSTSSPEIYKNVMDNGQIKLYKYKDQYVVDEEELMLPKSIEVATNTGMGIGIALAAAPFFIRSRFGRRWF